ncbi:hypothetical protein KA005_65575, partial [bacterium]|nr:hypothetical protein [bacterium]
MTTMNDNPTGSEVALIVDDFLAEFPQPEDSQWEKLIEQHPNYVGEITDFALLYSSMEDLSDEDVNSELNVKFYEATVSNALDLVLSTPSPVLEDIEKHMSNLKGTAVKELAVDMGLGKAPVLMSQILGGVTR